MTTHTYRYKTPALIGHWRPTLDEAVSDALAAGQAYPDPESDRLIWRDDARIERQSDGADTAVEFRPDNPLGVEERERSA